MIRWKCGCVVLFHSIVVIMKKKPSSAKRSIQQQAFSPYVSSKRLGHIQSLLLDPANKEDAISIILGIDSRYNEGCRELANYILFGFYDLRLSQFEDSGIPEEELDDVIILIRASSVSVYCSPVLCNYLLPYIAHWRNLDIYCWPNDDQEQTSEEEREEFKIQSFVSMLHGSTHIGIPYWATRSLGIAHRLQSPTNFDKFAIEKWPLIQSYALEGVGGGGFFTMNFEVSNIRNSLLPIYEECDPADLEQILIRSLPLFERHWMEAVSTVSGESGNGDGKTKIALLNITEKQVVEPLTSYFKHGRLSAKYRSDEVKTVEPYVRFGCQTLDKFEGHSLIDVTLKNSGIHGNTLHMVIHSVAPRRPISCIRTYFVSPSRDRESTAKKDFNLLIRLYSACTEACQAAIDEYCSSFDSDKVASVVSTVISKACAHYPHSGAHECNLEAFTNSGSAISLDNGKPSMHIKKMTVSINSIKSTNGVDMLGSVCYADTFIDSTIVAVKNDDMERTTKLTEHVVLTSGISRYMQWNLNDIDTEMESNSVVKCENLHLCCDSSLCSGLCGMELFDDGSIVISPIHSPRFVVYSSSVKSYEYYNNELPNAVTLLQINVKSSVLPTYTSHPDKNKIALVFYPQSSGLKSFITKGLPLLKSLSSKNPCVDFVELGHVDDDMVIPHKEIQYNYMWQAGISHRDNIDVRTSKLTRSTMSLQPKLTDFMKHLAVSFVLGDKAMPEADLNAVLECDNIIKREKTIDKEAKVCVSIVAGIPGCHGDKLCSSLVSLHRERVRWVVVRVKSEGGNATRLDEDNLQKQLGDFVAKRRAARPGAAASKKLRIIIEAIGFFDITSIASCVINHPNRATRERMFIGAVTVCIDPLTCYIEHNLLLPKVLEQCTDGVVNCVAFTGILDDLKDKNLASMQLVVRSVNQNAAFLLAAGGCTSRTGDFDLVLSENSFESEENVRTRHLATPGLWNRSFNTGESPCKMQDILLEFSQPLLKGTFSARLRALRNSMASHPYTGNIYMVRGIIAFTDSQDQQNDICFVSKTGNLSIEPRVQPQTMAPAPPPSKNAQTTRPFYLRFYGMGLCEDSLREWLRKCGRQKPTKKCHRTKATMSRAERKRLQTLHQNDPLPEGVFYNGTQYCSLIDNSRSYEHPSLDQFISEYLKAENEEIDVYNKKVEAQNIVDLFA